MSQFSYKNSRVFAELKATKEAIPGNMTSYQYLSSYDELLRNAVDPIVRESTFARGFVASLMGWQEKHFRRKVSFLPRATAIQRGFEFLVAHPERRVHAFHRIRLERGIMSEMVEGFLAATAEASRASNLDQSLRLEGEDWNQFYGRCRSIAQSMEDAICCPNLVRVRRESEYWMTTAVDFREKILQKYYRLCLTTAQRDYVGFFNMSVPLDDIINSYLVAAARAIDKCDFRQGVLTSHIAKWFLTARDQVGKSRSSSSLQLNDAIPIDDLEAVSISSQESELIKLEEHKVLVDVARLVDPQGIGRTFLRIRDHES